jgi:hypothetical protein
MALTGLGSRVQGPLYHLQTIASDFTVNLQLNRTAEKFFSPLR